MVESKLIWWLIRRKVSEKSKNLPKPLPHLTQTQDPDTHELNTSTVRQIPNFPYYRGKVLASYCDSSLGINILPTPPPPKVEIWPWALGCPTLWSQAHVTAVSSAWRRIQGDRDGLPRSGDHHQQVTGQNLFLILWKSTLFLSTSSLLLQFQVICPCLGNDSIISHHSLSWSNEDSVVLLHKAPPFWLWRSSASHRNSYRIHSSPNLRAVLFLQTEPERHF